MPLSRSYRALKVLKATTSGLARPCRHSGSSTWLLVSQKPLVVIRCPYNAALDIRLIIYQIMAEADSDQVHLTWIPAERYHALSCCLPELTLKARPFNGLKQVSRTLRKEYLPEQAK